MKKILLYIIAITAFSLLGNAQNVNIPDANFKAYLLGFPPVNTNNDSEIQVSEANAFTGILSCSNMSIADLTGIEEFTAINQLHCTGNNLTNINLSQNFSLTHLLCSNNNLTTLTLGNTTGLINFSCDFNNLNTLDVSQHTNLEHLSFGTNNLTSLDISQNTMLNYLSCSGNNLNALDLSQNTVLVSLSCGSNNLTSLILGQNQALTNVFCDQNNLTSLDVSQTPSITTLWCYNNALTILDPSQNVNLTDLSCHTNNINSLDLSNNINLTNVTIYNNSLTSLNMKNLSPTSLTAFNSIQNPNLTCIEVDDVAAATAAWTNIDAASSFSLSCVTLVSSIAVLGQVGANTITTPAGTLQIDATVLPANADDATYTWSVTNGTGSATINTNGLLTALTDGIVTVTATANDASGITGTTVITIETIVIMDITGKKIETIVTPTNTIDVSH